MLLPVGVGARHDSYFRQGKVRAAGARLALAVWVSKADEDLSKECVTWKKKIRELWVKVGEASRAGEAQGNTAAKMYKEKEFLFGEDTGGR